MKIRKFFEIEDGVYICIIKTEDWSENDSNLMLRFGEPEIDVGGEIIVFEAVTGEHTGNDGVTTLTDSTKDWTVSAFIGRAISRSTPSGSSVVSANTHDTISTSDALVWSGPRYVLTCDTNPTTEDTLTIAYSTGTTTFTFKDYYEYILTCGTLPIDDETLQINYGGHSTTFTFKDILTSPAVETEVHIETSIAATMSNLADAMTAISTDTNWAAAFISAVEDTTVTLKLSVAVTSSGTSGDIEVNPVEADVYIGATITDTMSNLADAMATIVIDTDWADSFKDATASLETLTLQFNDGVLVTGMVSTNDSITYITTISTYALPKISFLLPTDYRRIKTESSFVHKFDSRDYTATSIANYTVPASLQPTAKVMANAWANIIEQRLIAAITAMREATDTYTGEKVTTV